MKIPWVRKDLSSRQVLVMEWIEGVRCSDVLALQASGIDLEVSLGGGWSWEHARVWHFCVSVYQGINLVHCLASGSPDCFAQAPSLAPLYVCCMAPSMIGPSIPLPTCRGSSG